MSLFDLSGKTAIVTGGSSGLLGPIWCDAIQEAGGEAIPYDLPGGHDVTNKWDISEFVREFQADFGPPDILVNNAAIDNPPGSKATFFGNFDDIMKVNIGGAVSMCNAVIPAMIRNGGGVIVNIGSIQGNIGADWRNYDPGFEKPVAYNCSKAGLVQLSRSIAVQYGRYNIRSVTISFALYDGGKVPSEFKSKFLRGVPLGRPISKESVQQTLLYACCCPELTGQQVLVDGGYTAW